MDRFLAIRRSLCVAAFTCAAIASIIAWGGEDTRADVIVTSWSLNTFVDDNTGPATVRDLRFSNTVQNPFSVQFHTSVFIPPNTTHFANADHVFAWSPAGNVGSFDVAFDQRLGGPRAFASTNANTIQFTSTVDLLVDISGTMNFTSSAADEADFLFSIWLASNDPLQGFFSESERGGRASFGAPASGVISFSGTDILLPGDPAGRLFAFGYTVSSRSPTVPFINAPLTANGSIHFSFRPVPETTSLGMLSLCAVALVRHRRRAARR